MRLLLLSSSASTDIALADPGVQCIDTGLELQVEPSGRKILVRITPSPTAHDYTPRTSSCPSNPFHRRPDTKITAPKFAQKIHSHVEKPELEAQVLENLSEEDHHCRIRAQLHCEQMHAYRATIMYLHTNT